jgi:hypothetical protein
MHACGLLGHVQQAGAVALPAQGLVHPEMIDLKPAQRNGSPDAPSHPVAVVAQEQGQRDTRQVAGLLNHVSLQAGSHVIRSGRTGFFENLDLHAVASGMDSAVATCLSNRVRSIKGLARNRL